MGRDSDPNYSDLTRSRRQTLVIARFHTKGLWQSTSACGALQQWNKFEENNSLDDRGELENRFV
jgi:hypothetical protein